MFLAFRMRFVHFDELINKQLFEPFYSSGRIAQRICVFYAATQSWVQSTYPADVRLKCYISNRIVWIIWPMFYHPMVMTTFICILPILSGISVRNIVSFVRSYEENKTFSWKKSWTKYLDHYCLVVWIKPYEHSPWVLFLMFLIIFSTHLLTFKFLYVIVSMSHYLLLLMSISFSFFNISWITLLN